MTIFICITHRRLRQRNALLSIRSLHELLLYGGGEFDSPLVCLDFVTFGNVEKLETTQVLLALCLDPLLEQELADGLLIHDVVVPDICEQKVIYELN